MEGWQCAGADVVVEKLGQHREGDAVVVAIGRRMARSWLDGVRPGQHGQYQAIVLIQGGERSTANALVSAGADVLVTLMDGWQRDVVDGVS